MNATEMKAPPDGTYTPAYARQKALMIIGGVIVLILGVCQLWPPLHLVAFGNRTLAEATDVIKAKAGVPDLVLKDDAQIQNHLETQDRSYTFWNNFCFQTADGRMINVRATVGSQLKPLYPLIDSDGMPTTVVLYYDPAHPEIVVFPDAISTWFASGTLVFMGLLTSFIGSVLLYWANKPIALPHLSSTNQPLTGT